MLGQFGLGTAAGAKGIVSGLGQELIDEHASFFEGTPRLVGHDRIVGPSGPLSVASGPQPRMILAEVGRFPV